MKDTLGLIQRFYREGKILQELATEAVHSGTFNTAIMEERVKIGLEKMDCHNDTGEIFDELSRSVGAHFLKAMYEQAEYLAEDVTDE